MQITYEKIKQVLAEKGYELYDMTRPEGWPELTGRTLMTITPEMAQSLLRYNGRLNETLQRRSGQIFDNAIVMNTWTPDMDEINLYKNYRLMRRTRLMKAIANGGHPVQAYVNMKEDGKFGFNTDNEVICSLLIDTIKKILEKYNKTLPELDQSIWEEELPKELDTKLDIMTYDYVRSVDEHDSVRPEQVIVGVLSNDRTQEFPDMLYIIAADYEGDAVGYPCTLFPAINESIPLMLKPGIYKNLLTPDNTINDANVVKNGLIQLKSVPLYIPKLKNKIITDYELSDYTFMRVSIPAIQGEEGIMTVGAKFDTTNTENLFLSAFDFDFAEHDTTYIILEEGDFE